MAFRFPAIYPGRQIVHLPTMKTHGHAVMTGSVKNSFGGLLREVRHYAHKYMHEVLVDLLYMQRELHPGVFTVMDGTVAGDGAGPRTMIPRIKNLLLAASDSVAIDAIAARLMGFDPMSIPFLRMAHERRLGVADPRYIEARGRRRERGELRLHHPEIARHLGRPADSQGLPATARARAASLAARGVGAVCIQCLSRHDVVSDGRPGRIREFMRTEWGQLFRQRPSEAAPQTVQASPR